MPKLSSLRSLASATVVVVLASCADNKGVTVLGSPGASSPAGGAADKGGAGAPAAPGAGGASAVAGSADAGGAAEPVGFGGSGGSAGSDAATSGHGGTGGTPLGNAGAATGSAGGGNGGGAGGAHGGATTTGGAGQGGTGGGAAGSVTGGASGTGGGATTPTECAASSDCLPTQHCNSPDPAARKMSCGPSGAGAATLGEGCLGNESCTGGLCDVFAKTCSVGCKGASDCGAGNACIASYILGSSPPWTPNLCQRSCTKDADCPPDVEGKHVCSLQSDVITDTATFACGPFALASTPGVKGFGAQLTSVNDLCENGFRLSVAGPNPPPGDYCSRACSANADCAAPFPTCTTVYFKTPSGVGTGTPVKVCSL